MTVGGISLRRVRKAFNGVVALDNLDLDLRGDGIVAVIGPNGAGKTTLLDVATARLPPEAGTVEIAGMSLTPFSRPHQVARHGVARTFQELRLFRHMTVLDNVMVARRPQLGEHFWRGVIGFGIGKEEGTHRDEALRLLDVVGLCGERDSLAGELSYGQQKLIALAQCLATNAQILLLDEPVAGVHPQLVEVIVDILRTAAAKEGKLVVLVEHDLSVVRRLADRLVVLDHGRLIADGSPAEVLARSEILEAYVG